MAMRVKSSTGSDNARWRREFGHSDMDQPESDKFRGFADTTRTMKSSTMKVAKAIASKPQQRRSRNGKNQTRMDKRALLYSTLRNQFRKTGTGNYDRAGALDIPGWNGQKVLTDVTAVAKNETNRARSEVSGVVSGVGQVIR